ncbi:MAG: Yip1 family protein [Ignavibacteria bacterium]
MEDNKDQTETTAGDSLPVSPEPDITLGDAMAGVFSEPGDTFASVKKSQKKNYWLLPLLIVIIISILSSFLVLRDEELSAEIKDKQKAAMQERIDKAVKEGKMSKEDADKQLEQSQKFMSGGMMMVFGVIGSFFAVVIFFFLKGLIYWGSVKIFKGTAGFKDVLNVLGLAGLITSIQLIIDTVLAVLTGKLLTNIGPVLLFTEESVGKSMYKLIANFDLINIWYLVIVGIGLAKVSDLNSNKTIPLVFGLWIIWILLSSFGPLSFLMGG